MIKKIMVPIAFSPYSRGILDYAADLASSVEAELLIVNVINDRVRPCKTLCGNPVQRSAMSAAGSRLADMT